MNYELAKQLKDAGFPLKQYPSEYEGDAGANEFRDGNILFIVPTLSELIEACGEKFDSLIKYESGWCAGIYHTRTDSWAKRYGKGSTPEEAVAKLWIALNKKA